MRSSYKELWKLTALWPVARRRAGLWPAPRWRAAERVRGKVGAMGIAANSWLREQNLMLLLVEAASYYIAVQPANPVRTNPEHPNWTNEIPDYWRPGPVHPATMARAWPLRWLMWFTYCRCLRNQLKCHFLQIEFNHRFLHMLQQSVKVSLIAVSVEQSMYLFLTRCWPLPILQITLWRHLDLSPCHTGRQNWGFRV